MAVDTAVNQREARLRATLAGEKAQALRNDTRSDDTQFGKYSNHPATGVGATEPVNVLAAPQLHFLQNQQNKTNQLTSPVQLTKVVAKKVVKKAVMTVAMWLAGLLAIPALIAFLIGIILLCAVYVLDKFWLL